MSAPAGRVTLERRGAFWFARLDRAAKRNALSEAMIEGLVDALRTVGEDATARGLVLWGAGGHFCAGADFDRFAELMLAAAPATGADPVTTHNRGFGAMLERLRALPVPTIAVVRGSAMGGGCGLAAACDRVIAATDARFALPEVSIGVVPAQIAPFVTRRVGASRARWLMQTAARLDAAEALAAGLADRVVPLEGLGPAVADDLASLAACEPVALQATKGLCAVATDTPLTAALDVAAVEFARVLRTGAALEGMAALRERRRAAWHVEVPALPEFA